MKEDHGVVFTDLAQIFSVLKKCRGRLDCLIQEMPFICEWKWRFNLQSDSICVQKVFTARTVTSNISDNKTLIILMYMYPITFILLNLETRANIST